MKTKHILLAAGLCLAALSKAAGQPVIIMQPEGRSVSLGVEVVFSVTAVSPLPITYQWRKDSVDLPAETSDILVFANPQAADAGAYTVVVSDSSGSVTSQAATLTVDAAFSKIILGEIVNDGGGSLGASWADYDNDGWLDLFVANVSAQNDFLYHNNGDGTFTRITSGVVVTDGANSRFASWGDYDNDGGLDLFVTTLSNNLLYHNNGDGTFTRITDSIVANDGGSSNSASWADYDNDGDLDLCVSNNPGPKFLYRNDGNGTFTKVTDNILVTDSGNFAANAWGDYDNDGDQDLFVVVAGGNNVLYRNDGGGTFTKITTGILVNEGGASFGCAWGDYDNDGWLDLYVCNGGVVGPAINFLYHNNGDGTFTKITSGDIVNESRAWQRCAWGDYDNDSFLDMFVTERMTGNNQLFHNNGDGTFTKITTGSLVNDGGQSGGCVWGDYDNDGFLDLFVSNGVDNGNENNFLYRNNGNGNSWIKLRLAGYLSNRFGVGAKIKINAIIGATDRWLTRSIEAGDSSDNASALVIGLGDATSIDTLRVEWPSGMIQEWHDVAVNQFLTVTDPPSLGLADVTVSEGDSGTTNALFTVRLTGPLDTVVNVDYEAINGTALAGVDYLPASGTLTFLPGETSQTINVIVPGNILDQSNRTFFVNLTHALNAPINRSQALGTILDDDPLPVVSINDVMVVEGDSGTKTAVFTLRLSTPSALLVRVRLATANGTATAGSDYTALNNLVVSIPAGTASQTLSVMILGDTVTETNETFFVNLGGTIANGMLGDGQGAGTILDDDFRVIAPEPSEGGVRVRFATIAGRSYEVQRTDNLTPPVEWTPVAGAATVPGTGSLVEVTDAGAGGAAQRFYRVVLLPWL